MKRNWYYELMTKRMRYEVVRAERKSLAYAFKHLGRALRLFARTAFKAMTGAPWPG